jgi:DNA repair photolyase
VGLISKFDPWRSSLCTCPSKFTFNPYTGCDHGCLYCYASTYIPHFTTCRPKKDLITRLKNETTKLKGELVSVSNSSDPYPQQEAKLGLTRKSLRILTLSNCKLQVITKSDLVTRDADLLSKVPSMVSLTITTLSDETAKTIEPNAPSPSKRLKAAETLLLKHIPVTVRIDPIIPYVNDDTEPLILKLAETGIRHVTCSTYKARPDNWHRLAKALPDIKSKLKPIYYVQGENINRTQYLPKQIRYKLMTDTRKQALRHGLGFAVCREGFPELNTATCDGSSILKNAKAPMRNILPD